MNVVIAYVNALCAVFLVTILGRIVLSWVPSPPVGRVTSALWRFFHQSTEWYLRPFRRVVLTVGMTDLSPIVAIIVLYVANAAAVRVLEVL
ncbi:MAG: YggT family protein [Thermoleophilia bacterium]|nr:YggT family protein [Thermoleophilia bacterium]